MRQVQRWAAGASILGVLMVSLGGCANVQNVRASWPTLDGSPPLVIAHRGASGYLPEHTLEAYTLAIEQGADIIEPDLVITRDGVLVARHDRFLSTTTDVQARPEFRDRRRANDDPAGPARIDWWVEDFTLAEIKTLKARQPFPGRSQAFDDLYDIPTFEEILGRAHELSQKNGRTVGIYPETKHPGFFAAKGLDFEAPLLDALATYSSGPVFIQSFEPEILKRLNGKTRSVLVQLVFEVRPGSGPNIPLSEIAQFAGGVGPAKSIIFADGGAFVRAAHDLGLRVHPWTFRDDAAPPMGPEAELKAAFALGVDGVFTDFPDSAVGIREAMVPGR